MVEVPQSTPVVGQLLDGRYKIVREIASGGMSVVYEAIHVKIGRIVAIKVLHRDMAGDPEVVGRFLNEARAVGTFGHPHIVASTDFGELPGHVPYLVLEYLQGHTLSAEVQKGGPLPVRRAALIALQIASALDAAHARNVVHRDLTAANIFLVQKEGNPDHVKVLDFGISKFLTVTNSGPKTRRGLTMGTPEYMAPEQISDPDAVDSRVDVYALGVIMYLMLSGDLPFTRTPLQSLLTQIVVDPPPHIERHGLPEGLRAIVLKALAKSPDDRFVTMREMGLEIERLAARIFSGGTWDASADVPGLDSGAVPRLLPRAQSQPVSGSIPRPPPISGSISRAEGLVPGQTPAPGVRSVRSVPTTEPVIEARGGRGLLYAALLLALVSVGGVAVLAVRAQRGAERRAEAPPPTPEPSLFPAQFKSSTPLSRVTLRGRTHLLPFAQEFKAGTQPEIVELTAPGKQGRRFWITFDRPVALKTALSEGRGVVEATEEETVVALGGEPVPGAAVAGEHPGEDRSAGKPAGGASHHGGHKRSSGKVARADEAPAEPKAVPSLSPSEPKGAAPGPTGKPEAREPEVAPSGAKPGAGAAPEAAIAAQKAHATPPPPTTAQPPVTSGLDPAKTQALVRSHLPEVQRCYERGRMDDPELKGRVTMKISVSATGAVTSAVVENSSLRSSAVESCVVDAVKGWKFPAPVGGPAVLLYPFNLR